MRNTSRFSPAFDGLPLLSGASFHAPGLFFLRLTYLLFSAIPLLLSLLKAVFGFTQSFLFYSGILILAIPLFLDVIRRVYVKDADMTSLCILLSCAFLIRFGDLLYAAALLYFYHLCDLFLSTLLRSLRERIDPDRTSVGIRELSQDKPLHFGSGEVLSVDCKVLSGSAVCSMRLLDPSSGDFEVESGDILFSGTLIEEGTLVCECLPSQSKNLQTRISERLKSAWNSKSVTQNKMQTLFFFLQAFLIAFEICFAAQEKALFEVSLVVFLCLPFLSDLFFRVDRLRLLLAFDRMQRFGIYPASMQVLSRIYRTVSRLCVIDARKLKSAALDQTKRRYYPAFHLASRHLSVLEYAGESRAMITRADLVLLFRPKEALLAHAALLTQTTVLEKLFYLLFLVLCAALFLLLSLGASFLWALACAFTVLLFTLLILWRVYHPLRESFVIRKAKRIKDAAESLIEKHK